MYSGAQVVAKLFEDKINVSLGGRGSKGREED